MDGSSASALLPFVLLAVLFWLLVFRPTRSRQRQSATVQQALSPGVEVMTTSGLFGRVTNLTDERVTLEIADGVHVDFSRAAVARVIDPATDSAQTSEASSEGAQAPPD